MPETPFPWPEGKRCAVSLTFDDARDSQLDAGLPILDRHGITATFYVSLAPFKARAAEWKRASDSGHEIGNHTASHPCSGNFPWARKNALEDYTLERMTRELDEAGRAIEAVTGRPARSFAYPCGQTFVGRESSRQSYIPLIASKFAAGRGFLWETHAHPSYGDLAHLPAVWCDNIPVDALLPRLDGALADGGWLILAGHEVAPVAGYHNTLTATLDAFCGRLAKSSADVWTAPVAGIADWIRTHRPG